jgi:predicted Fe-Mo cluster-binding NifX family protein
MTIALTTQGPTLDEAMDPRFGRARYFLLFDDAGETIEAVDNVEGMGQAHGAGPRAVRALVDHGVEVLITGNGPGGNAAMGLKAAGISVYVGAGQMTAREALTAYRDGALEPATL